MRLRRRGRIGRLGVAGVTGLAAVALAAGCSGPSTASESSPATVPARPGEAPDPAILPAAAGVDVPMRLAEGVIPPTNRWYSSLAFGEPGLPVFPKPLSFQTVDGGFAMGLTVPHASADAILAPAVADVTVTIEGATGHGEVVEATSVGVTLELGPVDLTLAQGVPAIAVSSAGGAVLTLAAPFDAAGDAVGGAAGDAVATATINGTVYGVAVSDGEVDGATLSLDPGGTAQLFAVPAGGDATELAAALGEPARGATAGFALGDAATTTIVYGDEPTVVAVPASRTGGLDCGLGTYATIAGTYEVCRASSVSWDVPAIAPTAALDLSDLTEPETRAVRAALLAESAATPELPADTYFGSKSLYRLANLLQVADALGEDAAAADLAAMLGEQLRLWGDAEGCTARAERCFTYDATMKGVVGLATAFGSEEFNDHHFHYGYLLYAAAVAGARDPVLAQEIGDVIDLVAEDIAAPGTSDAFPVRRAFDPVEGHSWASGISPFADGNNQESSSEAVLAYNAVALWADVRGDDALGESARWMLAAEAEASRRLWLAPDLEGLEGYAHPIVAIQWGAKRDYATWFSADPAAMLGIQLIPAQPAAMAYLAEVPPAGIVAAVDEAWGAATPGQFADYLLMYRALAGDEERAAAWEAAQLLTDDQIDDGSSRTWLLAWIAAAG